MTRAIRTPWIGILGGLIVWGASAEEITAPMISTSPTAEAEALEKSRASAGVEKPVWLLRAEQALEESLAAEQAGDLRLARRKLARALKWVGDGADETTLLALRPQISDLMNVIGQPPPPLAGTPPLGDLLAEREKTPAPAPFAALPEPTVSTRTYAMRLTPEDPLVKKYVALYTGPLRGRTQEAFDRMGRYMEMVLRTIDEEKMPRELAYLPIVESEYQPFAVSRAGAVGMWQFMSGTAKYAGLKINYWIDERRDPDKSTRAAMKTLRSLYDWFDDWSLALAAYNRGLYGIQRDLEFTRSTDFSKLSGRKGVPQETEHYVPKWMAFVLIGEKAEHYGFRPPSPARVPQPDTVLLEKPLDLKVAAACARTTEAVIRELNPSVRLWVTPSNEVPFAFRVPARAGGRFLEELAKVKEWTPSPGTVRYTVQKGDILGRIAKQFRTTPAAIQRENKIANPNRLRPKQVLIIRPGRGFKGE